MRTQIVMTCNTTLEEIPELQENIKQLIYLPPLSEEAKYRDIKITNEDLGAGYDPPMRRYRFQCIDWEEKDGIYVASTQRFYDSEAEESQNRVTFLCVLSPKRVLTLHSSLEEIADKQPLPDEAKFRCIHVAGTSRNLSARIYDKLDENIILDVREYAI